MVEDIKENIESEFTFDESLDFTEVENAVWELPKSGKMNVPVRVFATKAMLNQMKNDRTLKQARNVACLPGIVGASMVMPDGHEGYGFPIGGVAAFDPENDGIVSPGGVGYDINCGVRMLRTDLTYDEVKPKIKDLLNALYKNVPCGVGSKGRIRLKDQEFEDAVTQGPKYFIDQGLGLKEDMEHCEENAHMDGADLSKVSEMARKRGGPQFGTLGSGNHFLELQKVDEIYDKETAKAFGITKKGQVTIMIHSGSRGFGHQICSDYVREFVDAVKKYKIELPDRNLVCAPLGTKEADNYFAAMNCAINFAFSNRHIMAQWTRETLTEVFKREWEGDLNVKTVYDVCHNIAKFEDHEVDGKMQSLCVHRKGATRALWAGRKEVPKAYRKVGQPVVIPGSMSTASYMLVGTPSGKISMGSSNHGAGRVMSRAEAIRTFKGEDLVADMAKHGIGIRAPNMKSIAEEAGAAYKDVDQVIESVRQSGISKPVCRLTPIGVVKG